MPDLMPINKSNIIWTSFTLGEGKFLQSGLVYMPSIFYEEQGGNSQNIFGKFVRFFVTLRCLYKAITHTK